MSTETNQYDMSQFSDETRQLLASGLSAVAAQQAMGLGTGEEAEQRRREQEELAADMERKNREIQLKRAAAVTGGPVVAPSEVPEQKPKLKGRRKKQMPSQEPTVVPDARIKPATPIPESPVQDSQLPPGLTQEDIALIERVRRPGTRQLRISFPPTIPCTRTRSMPGSNSLPRSHLRCRTRTGT